MDEITSTALVPSSPSRGGELALPTDLIDRARTYAEQSRSPATRKVYARCWRDFNNWCQVHKRLALPANVDTIIAYVTWLASGRDCNKPLAISSIDQALAAIKLMQRNAGFPFDEKCPALFTLMKGIRREIAKTRATRRVKPLMQDDLRELLSGLKPDVLRDARDAALIGLGWAAALRRSELVGLDYGRLGSKEDERRIGFLSIDDKTLTVTLMTSKASQDTAETVIVPRVYAPLSCEAFDNWIALAKIQPGEPIFRAIEGKADGKRVAIKRMDPGTVARIIKRRVELLIKSRTKQRRKLSKDELKALVERFAGHSLRVGYVSSARARRVDRDDVMRQTRHKTATMIAVYDREVDKVERSGLNGVGV
jgi:integrase